ncbi:MAG: hypothetical protein JO197_12180 [Acidobacteria bacterium]|nr:hypothetical protein [Acidobacteriota bacterium]MBV9475312.1 hypothetical protein [Acidobacteriota bacterium]
MKRRRAYDTPLGHFMQAHRIGTATLARIAGISSSHLRDLQRGGSEPTRLVMIWLAEAVSYEVGWKVEVAELFDLIFHFDRRRLVRWSR